MKKLKKKIDALKKDKTDSEREAFQLKREIENLQRRNLDIFKKEKQSTNKSLNKSRGSPDSRLEFLNCF